MRPIAADNRQRSGAVPARTRRSRVRRRSRGAMWRASRSRRVLHKSEMQAFRALVTLPRFGEAAQERASSRRESAKGSRSRRAPVELPPSRPTFCAGLIVAHALSSAVIAGHVGGDLRRGVRNGQSGGDELRVGRDRPRSPASSPPTVQLVTAGVRLSSISDRGDTRSKDHLSSASPTSHQRAS